MQRDFTLCLNDDCDTITLDTNQQKYKKFDLIYREPKKYAIKAVLENKNIYKTID